MQQLQEFEQHGTCTEFTSCGTVINTRHFTCLDTPASGYKPLPASVLSQHEIVLRILIIASLSMSFKGHTVVVTGAGGGLGKTCVLFLFGSRKYSGSPAAVQLFTPLRFARRKCRRQRL